jgi:hypothetical protein
VYNNPLSDRREIGRLGGYAAAGFQAAAVGLLISSLAACSTVPAADAPVAETVMLGPPKPAAPELPKGVRLVGMDSAEVQGLLGQPALQRREQPAQYWRYSYAGCILDLFLYVEQPSGILRVAYYEIRPDDRPGTVSNPRCERIQATLGRMADGGDLPPVETH